MKIRSSAKTHKKALYGLKMVSSLASNRGLERSVSLKNPEPKKVSLYDRMTKRSVTVLKPVAHSFQRGNEFFNRVCIVY